MAKSKASDLTGFSSGRALRRIVAARARCGSGYNDPSPYSRIALRPKQITASPDAPVTGFTAKGTPSPLAQAVRAGSLLFVSGQGPLDPKTREVVSADIREQTRQTLTTLKSVLAAAGL